MAGQCFNRYVMGILLLWIFAMVFIYLQTTSVSWLLVPKSVAKSPMTVLIRSKENKTALTLTANASVLAPPAAKAPITSGAAGTVNPNGTGTTKPALEARGDKGTVKPTEAKPKQACVHPKLDPKDPGMMRLYRKVKKTVCPGKDWVYVDNGTLRFTASVVKEHKGITCDYHALIREAERKNKYAAAVKNISNPFTITDDAFKVTCKGGDKSTYENIHQGVAYRKSYVDRKQDPLKKGFEGLSVAILGFDSMSRMSWLRRLPVTRKYLVEKLGAVELEQHNILGDGTTAVMFPMLTGKFEWELPECRIHFKGAKQMDNFPWIWHDYKKAGYLTSWSNAQPGSAPFNWRMLGFKDPPTDFYPRPFYVAAFPTLKKYPKFCLGSQSRHDIWLNWFRDIFHMYKNQRKFLFHFITDMSHDDNNLLTAMDEPIEQLIKHLQDDGYLNNTLLILMGDHGARYFQVRSTISGKLEERLPYFSLLFPPWFEKKYPEAMRNLRTNAKRLTTPFDLHETFKEILDYTGSGMGDVTKRGISLFKEVPMERTCKHADIASHWCACLDWKDVKITETGAKNALQTALDTINGYTKNQRSECALLSVANVTMATKMEMGKDLLKFKSTDANGGIYKINFSSKHKNEKALYQITFYTTPGGGHFEVTVSHDLKKNTYSLSEKEISRINMYGNASHCILDKNRQIRQYCYCKDLIKS